METILVIERESAFPLGWPQGFLPAEAPAVTDVLRAINAQGFLVEREVAERNPLWKQPIPYCVLVRGAEVFCVERLPKQGESRLHGRLSLGLGGHIDARDTGQPCGVVRAALERELREEVHLQESPGSPIPAPRLLGLLNDDATEVGKVHFGVVFGLQVPASAKVKILESSKMRGAFRHLAGPDGLWQDLHRFESWSRILLEARAVEPLASQPAPSARPES